MKYTRGRIETTTDNKAWYNHNGLKMTGETLTALYDDGTEIEYVVFKGRYTPTNTIRDCGDHYIHAKYSRYDKIDKTTLTITQDVADE